jgi:hypothetical protein
MTIDAQFFPSGLDHVLKTTALVSADLVSLLVDASYVFDPTDVALADVTAHVVETSDVLFDVTVTAGVVTSEPAFFSPTGGEVVAGYIIHDSTNNKLIYYSGRYADGRPIHFTTSSVGLIQYFTGDVLLRFGGVL